jgi:hypothetical protein
MKHGIFILGLGSSRQTRCGFISRKIEFYRIAAARPSDDEAWLADALDALATEATGSRHTQLYDSWSDSLRSHLVWWLVPPGRCQYGPNHDP